MSTHYIIAIDSDLNDPYQGGKHRMILVVNFLVFLKIHFFFALLYLIKCTIWNMEAMHSLCLHENLF